MRSVPGAWVIIAAVSWSWATPASASNYYTTIVLHAVDATSAACDDALTVDCNATLPTSNVTGMTSPAVFMLLWAYDECFGVQAAFDVPADWPFTFGLWNCQSNQLSAKEPAPPWGPTDGTITTAFDGITGGGVAAIGRLHFSAPGTGCINTIESSFPFGTHVIDSNQNATQVGPQSRSSVCHGIDGYSVCYPEPAVEPLSWGRVKQQYR